MKYLVILFLILIQAFLSCKNEKSEKSAENPNMTPRLISNSDSTFNTQPVAILKDFKSWWTYHYNNINLSEDFVALDTNLIVIKKEEFLDRLVTGKYVPLKMMVKKNITWYKLYWLNNEDPNIGNTISPEANKILTSIHSEGKPLPMYSFEDLNKNIYTPQNTKGKIIVLKCWFIHCVECVKEFPELNKIVQQYKDRKDILFISLAMDSKQDLVAFLADKEFDYAVVPNQKDYIFKELKASSFPTHILIGKDGKIRKVVWKWEDLFTGLQKEATK